MWLVRLRVLGYGACCACVGMCGASVGEGACGGKGVCDASVGVHMLDKGACGCGYIW